MKPDETLPIAHLGRHPNLRESVTESLTAAIISGALKEGTLYSAPMLGAAFGVSATPVREAMMDLARQGLVETVKNKGFRITQITDQELDEITEIRLLIEPPIVGRVAGKIPAEGYPRLRLMADDIVSAAKEGDLTEFLAVDRQFHAAILEYFGNARLVELATSLRARTRLYGIQSLSESHKLDESAREHHLIVDLLEAGDAKAAEQMMYRHISHARGLWATGQETTRRD
ncbi:GntR family transcriptional regulator [Nocardioides cavernaquae]|uniref:GntR family transcriptional regulator n=1 Tax=Nocardioides cavernaquae TaxID=2321396 RepID=UPI001EE5B46A|nr:GntR family transcriptional regulator [Nocardioides cavernaquae]